MRNRTEEAWELLAKAEKYRRLAGSVIDLIVKRQIVQLADELEERARELEIEKTRTEPTASRPSPSGATRA